EALSGGRCGGVAAWQRRAAVESRSRQEVSEESAAAGAGEVRRSGGRALRAPAGGGTGPHFPAGERTDGQRGLGGALRQSIFPTATAKPLLRASAEQSVGVRRAAWHAGHRVPRTPAALARDPGACPAQCSRCGAEARCGFDGQTEVGTPSPSSVARGRSPGDAKASLEGGRHATIAGLALGFALSAPPCGLRRAALQARPATN